MRRRTGRPPLWGAKRVAKLRKLWGTLSNAAIARELCISQAAVFRQPRRLALPPRRLKVWPRSRVATLRALWRRGLSMAAIGRQLGVSKSRARSMNWDCHLTPRGHPFALQSCERCDAKV
jgi:hypothetical protein